MLTIANLWLTLKGQPPIIFLVGITESLVTIPGEYLDTGLEMALLFLPSSNTYLDVFVVTKGQQEETDFSEILEQLDLVFTILQAILALFNVPTPPILPPAPPPVLPILPSTAQQDLFNFFFLE